MPDEQDATTTIADTGQPVTPTVDWDDSEMVSTYANIVNASTTREEVNIFFGTNQTWKAPSDAKFKVRLTNRISLSPYAAKRLWLLLGMVLKAYESRFGPLNLEGAKPDGQGTPKQ